MPADSISLEDVLAAGQHVLGALQFREQSATAKRALADANDALKSLERAVLLGQFESKRQIAVAKAREAAAAEAKAKAIEEQERKERAQHEATLKREAARSKALEAARQYLKNKQTKQKETTP